MVELKETTVYDLAQVSACHKAAFPKSLSSQMGLTYLKKMLSWYLSSEKTFLFHLEQKGVCIGYCGGMINDDSYKMGSASSMLQYSFKQGIIALLLRPWLLFQSEMRTKYLLVWRNLLQMVGLRKLPENSTNKVVAQKEPTMSLVVIGVRIECQGMGYGSLILKEFEARARRNGFSNLQLSVRSDNQQAIHTYEKNGWKKTGSNAASTVMGKKI